eukprot:2569859-Rhodomonas_salina.1
MSGPRMTLSVQLDLYLRHVTHMLGHDSAPEGSQGQVADAGRRCGSQGQVARAGRKGGSQERVTREGRTCLLYTSDAADDM